MPQPAASGPARPRLVLLGASNVTRGLSTVVETARRVAGGPVEIVAALGHGRSYGMTSRVLARTLPAILECGLWPALDAAPPAPSTRALVTDVGNDLVYGAGVETIIEWIDACLARLAAHGAETTLALPPLDGLERMRRWQFAAVRAILFPGRPIGFDEARAGARALHAGLVELAARRGVPVLRPDPAWYGLDPIHVRLRAWPEAWWRLLGGGEPARPARWSLRRWIRVRTALPEHCRLLGRPIGRPQPVRRLADGTTLALY
ncbi:MAG: hypothetical protein ACYTG1_10620 [Planctomycetota bacterium]